MPHVIIREEDNTVAAVSEEEYNVVYIPGAVDSEQSGEDYSEPRLFNNVADFVKFITGSPKLDIDEDNKNALMAQQLLSLGLYVLYEVVVPDGSGSFAAKVDWDKLSDKGKYRIKFLTVGAEPSLAYANKMLACAKLRGDCIALIDHEAEITPDSGEETVAEAVYKLFNSTASGEEIINGEYGASFSPWCKFKFGGNALTLPGSFAYLSAYAYAVRSNPNWYAAAGVTRGYIPGLVEPVYKYGDADCIVLQARDIDESGDFGDNDNNGIAINPIANIRPFGFVVWGNRTLYKNNGGLKASSFLNVRNLCCDIKKNVYKVARELTFEQNNEVLFANFKMKISGLLDRALSGNGIRGYKILKEATARKGCLKARIRIVPIEAVEDFDLTLELTDTLDSVNENI